MSLEAASIAIRRLGLYAFMFIELCFNFMSLFTYLSLMWYVTFFLSRLLFELCNPIAGGSA
jgi:hypothetical protein